MKSEFEQAVDQVRGEIKRRGWVYEWRQSKDVEIAYFSCTFGEHQFYIQIMVQKKGGAFIQDYIWYSYLFTPRHDFILCVGQDALFDHIERALSGEFAPLPEGRKNNVAQFMERFGAAELKGWGAYVEG